MFWDVADDLAVASSGEATASATFSFHKGSVIVVPCVSTATATGVSEGILSTFSALPAGWRVNQVPIIPRIKSFR